MKARLLLLAALTPASLCQAQTSPDPVPPHQSFAIASRATGDLRRLNVYLPPAYDSSSHRAFPVVYMPDGGLEEDFPHLANTLDSLIALGRVAAALLVGIENTERRRDLTGPTTKASDSAIAVRVGGSAAFRAFVREELMPEVRRRYRVTGETAIVGESLAGLFIVETMLLEPTLFRRYFAVDPSLWWNDGALAREAGDRLAALEGRSLFLTAAGEQGNGASVALLAETLRARAPVGFAWSYHPRPDLEHGTIFRAMLPEGLVEMLGGM